MKYYDILIGSLFEGEKDEIIFPFDTREEAVKEIERRFENEDGWELTQDKYDENKFYYDWLGNPSYEIYVREN